jgi:hypothetical protein
MCTCVGACKGKGRKSKKKKKKKKEKKEIKADEWWWMGLERYSKVETLQTIRRVITTIPRHAYLVAVHARLLNTMMILEGEEPDTIQPRSALGVGSGGVYINSFQGFSIAKCALILVALVAIVRPGTSRQQNWVIWSHGPEGEQVVRPGWGQMIWGSFMCGARNFREPIFLV